MAGTIFGIPFDEELFMQMWNEAPDPYLTAMIESGAVVEDPVIAERIANSGNFYTIPFYNTLDGEDQNYDGQTDIKSGRGIWWFSEWYRIWQSKRILCS